MCCVAVSLTQFCEWDCTLLIWLGTMLMRLAFALASYGLPVDSFFCFSSPILHWSKLMCHVFIVSPVGKKLIAWRQLQVWRLQEYRLLSISLFCYAWLGCTSLFQFMIELAVLVACSYFLHMTGIYTCITQISAPFCVALRQ